MSRKTIQASSLSIAIIGGGPAGSSLGTHLVRAGARVGLFRAPQRPKLLIGESLIPAVVTHLRELGVEDQIKEFSTYKPGATFYTTSDLASEIQFDFGFGAIDAPPYAYNTPRNHFDQAILDNAIKEGVNVIPVMAEVNFDPQTQKAFLSDSTLAKCEGWFERQPDFIIDATGRTRMFSRALNIPFKEGRRKDNAIFAHHDNVDVPNLGHIHVNRLKRGWSWRIPLPGRTSVGIVAPQEWVETFGSNTAEQYDNLIKQDPIIKKFMHGTRQTDVMKYNNYQLISERMFGPNWVLVGDAAGFIDPIFSSGLLLSFTGSKLLASALVSNQDFHSYERLYKRHLRAWQRVVDLFYDGRFFGLVRVSRIEDHAAQYEAQIQDLTLHLTRILTGVAPAHPDTQWAIRRSIRQWLPANNVYRQKIL